MEESRLHNDRFDDLSIYASSRGITSIQVWLEEALRKLKGEDLAGRRECLFEAVHNDFQEASLWTPLEALNDVLGAVVGANPTDV